MAMTKWIPTTNLMELRRLGKLGEELGELSNVASRCIIQGIDETDPGTGKVNRQRLLDELADVAAQIDCTVAAFGLDVAYFGDRRTRKRQQMAEWEAMFTDGPQQFIVTSIKHLAGVVTLVTREEDAVQPPLESGQLVTLTRADAHGVALPRAAQPSGGGK